MGIICELFSLPEDGVIHTEDIPFDPERAKVRTPILTANGFAYPRKNEKDYALELQESVLPITSPVTAIKVSSGICLEGQTALPWVLYVVQIHLGPVAVIFLL